MVKRVLVVVAIVLIMLSATAVIAYAYLQGRRYTIVLSNEDILRYAEKMFPVTKKHLLVVEATYKDPKIILHEGSNSVTLGISVALNIRISTDENTPAEKAEMLGGACETTASIRYEPKEYAFYLDKAHVDRLEVRGVPGKLESIVAALTRGAITYALQSGPAYTIRGDSPRKAVAKMVLKNVIVKDGKLHITLGV